MIKNLIFIFIIVLNFLFYLFFKEENINEVKIIIKPGMQLNQIANVLKQNGLIKNESIFKTWVIINNSQKELKFGEYYFNKKISLNTILGEDFIIWIAESAHLMIGLFLLLDNIFPGSTICLFLIFFIFHILYILFL